MRAVVQQRPAGWVGIAGAALAFLGSFLPWISIVSIFGTINIAGTNGDGKLTVPAALVSGGFLLWAVLAQEAGPALTAGVFGLVGLGVSVYDYSTTKDKVFGVSSATVSASVGIGLYLCIGGFIAATIGAFTFRSQLITKPTS